jgi:Mlc titration factor MtfA (ptsG expression regulator)
VFLDDAEISGVNTAPRRLRARHGELYEALREYLNQDPAAGRP